MNLSVRDLGSSAFYRLFRHIPPTRRWALDAIDEHWPAEIGWSLDLGGGLKCPLTRKDYRHSFSEIFLKGGYEEVLKHIEVPHTWVDVGCHAGYFSLWLLLQRQKRGLPTDRIKAALVDADHRAAEAVNAVIAANGLRERWTFIHGLVTDLTKPSFFCRDGMGSSIFARPEDDGCPVMNTPPLDERQVLGIFDQPIDLLKLDIEGAELIFLEKYRGLSAAPRSMLVEWHTWADPDARDKVGALCAEHGLARRVPIGAPSSVTLNGRGYLCGVDLFLRNRPGDSASS